MKYFIISNSDVLTCESKDLKGALAELREVHTWNIQGILVKQVDIKITANDGDSEAEIKI